MRLAFSAGELVLEAGSGDEAQASEALEAQLDGEDIAIAFNPDYLLDGLDALDTSHARLAFTTPDQARGASPGRPPTAPARSPDYRSPADAGAPVRLIAAGPAAAVGDGRGGDAHADRDWSASAGWAATWPSGCARAGTRSSATTGRLDERDVG